MLFSHDLETNSTVEYLKYSIEKEIENKSLHLPPKAMERIQELLSDEKITSEKLQTELKTVLESTNNFSWKIQLYLTHVANNLFDQLNIFSFRQLSLYIFFGFFILFLYKKFKKTPRIKILEKKANSFFTSILIRFSAMLAYLVPYLSLCLYYTPNLLVPYPSIRFLLPSFILDGMYLFQHIKYSGSIYFFTAMIIITRYKLPANRFVRFHLLKGLLFFAIQSLPQAVYTIITRLDYRDIGQVEALQLSLFLFGLNLYWLLPGLWEGLTLSYPKNPALREAIEVNLGPDEYGKWWDKDK
jgi:hypothetical protein